MVAIIDTIMLRTMAAVSTLKARLTEERGQDLLEYALLGGLIAAGIVAVLVLFTGVISTMMTNIGSCIDFTSSTGCNPGF